MPPGATGIFFLLLLVVVLLREHVCFRVMAARFHSRTVVAESTPGLVDSVRLPVDALGGVLVY